jgi:GNAT superfamily N-acetyltransferase
MPLYVRHRDDPAPFLPDVADLCVSREEDPLALATALGRPPQQMEERLAAGHRAYVAWAGWMPASWGWVASSTAEIGELGLRFRIPPRERYLWNFVTRPEHRGRGLYPRLLNAIVAAESDEAERFWIIHAPENHASASGIRKAGFMPAGTLSFDAGNRPALSSQEGQATAAKMLGVATADVVLAPCWRCARAGHPWIMFCPPGGCECDYQEAQSGCGG